MIFAEIAFIADLGKIYVPNLKKSIQKRGQANGGFHHIPCEECLNYKIQECDLNYYINSYKKKFPNRKISEVK